VFQLSDIQGALQASGASYKQVSSSLYIANSLADLNTICSTFENGNYPAAPYYQYYLPSDALTVLDFGKVIRIGLAGDPNILVFRLVGLTGTSSTGGLPQGNVPTSGFLVVGNKMAQTYNDYLYVGVGGSGYSF
jgi:hypothetical protein